MPQNEALAQSDAVLVIGGGIAGIKASLDLAETGRKVYIIDQSPALGGFLPLLDRQFPTNDCQICYLSPELAQCGHELDIEVLPLTTLTGIEGQAGGFTAGLKTEPRFIDTDLCTACGECLKAAPEGAVSFTPGLDHRAPTCMRYPQSVPSAYAIHPEKMGDDTSWTDCCEPGAIKLDQKTREYSVEVGSVILATGAELFDPTSMQEYYGYGKFEDVVTSLEFERILSASGPTGGKFQRPSDGREPKRIGWIQCVGSRSTREQEKPYCSSICCMFAMKEAAWALEHFEEDLDATIFFMDMRPMGKDYEQYYQRVKDDLGVNFVRCRPHTRHPRCRDRRSGPGIRGPLGRHPAGRPWTWWSWPPVSVRPRATPNWPASWAWNWIPTSFVEVNDFAPVSTSQARHVRLRHGAGPAGHPRQHHAGFGRGHVWPGLIWSRPRPYRPGRRASARARLQRRGAQGGRVPVRLRRQCAKSQGGLRPAAVIESASNRVDVAMWRNSSSSGPATAWIKWWRPSSEKGLNRVVVAGCSPAATPRCCRGNRAPGRAEPGLCGEWPTSASRTPGCMAATRPWPRPRPRT